MADIVLITQPTPRARLISPHAIKIYRTPSFFNILYRQLANGGSVFKFYVGPHPGEIPFVDHTSSVTFVIEPNDVTEIFIDDILFRFQCRTIPTGLTEMSQASNQFLTFGKDGLEDRIQFANINQTTAPESLLFSDAGLPQPVTENLETPASKRPQFFTEPVSDWEPEPLFPPSSIDVDTLNSIVIPRSRDDFSPLGFDEDDDFDDMNKHLEEFEKQELAKRIAKINAARAAAALAESTRVIETLGSPVINSAATADHNTQAAPASGVKFFSSRMANDPTEPAPVAEFFSVLTSSPTVDTNAHGAPSIAVAIATSVDSALLTKHVDFPTVATLVPTEMTEISSPAKNENSMSKSELLVRGHRSLPGLTHESASALDRADQPSDKKIKSESQDSPPVAKRARVKLEPLTEKEYLRTVQDSQNSEGRALSLRILAKKLVKAEAPHASSVSTSSKTVRHMGTQTRDKKRKRSPSKPVPHSPAAPIEIRT